jgi:hypothetical protein
MSVVPIVDSADTCNVLRQKGGMLLTKGRTRFGGKLQETAYDKNSRVGATEHRVRDIRKLGELILRDFGRSAFRRVARGDRRRRGPQRYVAKGLGGAARRLRSRSHGDGPNLTTVPRIESGPVMTADTPAWAREYRCREWRVLPIPPGSKGPVMRTWQDFEATSDDLQELFGGGENVGVILDRDLADVDIDCPEAIALAALYFPATWAIVGKPSQPRSHRIYTARVREAHPSASEAGPR